jgi:hypothetical protein
MGGFLYSSILNSLLFNFNLQSTIFNFPFQFSIFPWHRKFSLAENNLRGKIEYRKRKFKFYTKLLRIEECQPRRRAVFKILRKQTPPRSILDAAQTNKGISDPRAK